MQAIDLSPSDYTPEAPPAEIVESHGIALIGCGNIAQSAHLPAYRKFGYRLTAVCDVVEERAREVAEEYRVPFWTTDVDDVLDRDDVQIVDLTVRPAERLEIVKKIAAAGKNVLSQKPVAPTLEEAQQIAEVCEQAGVTLMVNQQARWASYHRALKVVAESGVLGPLFSVVHFHRQYQDGADFPFLDFPHMTMIDNGIHYVDLTRYFTGRTPTQVKATAIHVPGQNAVDPMIYTLLCDFEPSDLMASLHFNNIAPALHHSPYAWYLDGTEGSAFVARYGTLRDARTELVVSFKDDPSQRQSFQIEGQWAPDAWGGSMGEMLSAVAEGREPQTSGRDNLTSVRVTHAAVEAYTTGRTVKV